MISADVKANVAIITRNKRTGGGYFIDFCKKFKTRNTMCIYLA